MREPDFEQQWADRDEARAETTEQREHRYESAMAGEQG